MWNYKVKIRKIGQIPKYDGKFGLELEKNIAGGL